MTSRYRRCPRRLRRHKNKNALTVRPQFPRVAGKDFSTPWPSWRGLSPTGNREEETTWLEEPFNGDRKSTRLNSSHSQISYAVFCLKKKKKYKTNEMHRHTNITH